jgi:5-dehydro-2-deoxygluconokinase
MTAEGYDLVTMGRSSIDLYSQDIGAPFEEITSFGAYVGGCPTNIAVGAQRLGLQTALLTAVGQDPVGDFVLRFLREEGVDHRFIPKKAGRRTSAVLLGIQPPDKFPLVFYRDNCADLALTVDDVNEAPLDRTRALLITGTALGQEPSRSATLAAAGQARSAGAKVYLDLDFRFDQWEDPRDYAVEVAHALSCVDIALGTEEEVLAAAGAGIPRVQDSQMSSPLVEGDLDGAIANLLDHGLEALVVKRGAGGAEVHLRGGEVVSAEPFTVDVLNVLGAGDAFAAGLIYGISKGWDWKRCLRMANATGAIVVTRPGCANFMPTESEALAFVDAEGGW